MIRLTYSFTLRLFLLSALLVLACQLVGSLRPATQWIPVSLSSSLVNSDVYLFDTDYRLLVNLTRDSAREDSATISPDHQHMAYVRSRAGSYEIMLAEKALSSAMSLTESTDYVSALAWSPDGSQLAFVSASNRINNIYVMDMKENASRQLTTNVRGDKTPAWSPDGSWIVYGTLNGLDAFDSRCMTQCNKDAQHLMHNSHDSFPAWSPDGRQIAYISQEGTAQGIYIVGVTCLLQKTACPRQTPHLLSQGKVSSSPLFWSADGQQVIYLGLDAQGLPELYALKVNCDTIPTCTAQPLTAINRSFLKWSFQ